MGGGGGTAEGKRYSLQFSVNFSNLFNNVNLSTPVGNLSLTFVWSKAWLSAAALEASEDRWRWRGVAAARGTVGVSAQLRFNF
jgi:hypothetical protein